MSKQFITDYSITVDTNYHTTVNHIHSLYIYSKLIYLITLFLNKNFRVSYKELGESVSTLSVHVGAGCGGRGRGYTDTSVKFLPSTLSVWTIYVLDSPDVDRFDGDLTNTLVLLYASYSVSAWTLDMTVCLYCHVASTVKQLYRPGL